MKLIYLADARSPIAQNWISYFVEGGHDVHIVSSYPCASDVIPGAHIYQIPIAFAQFAGQNAAHQPEGSSSPDFIGRLLRELLRNPSLGQMAHAMRAWLGPIELRYHIGLIRELIELLRPDLIHAMRIPFEGLLASRASPTNIPLLISVWGNDFTLYANKYPLVRRETRRMLKHIDALHCDCERDQRLAQHLGFDSTKPHITLPGAGGIKPIFFNSNPDNQDLYQKFDIDPDCPIVINPRGFRGYVRNDVFFKAIPLVLKQYPTAIFLCVAMAGSLVAEEWIQQLGIGQNVRLLPKMPHHQMANLFRMADIVVSPSLHDGTPNTLLESMACGCFPVAGDIESVREWIRHGQNGLLCNPNEPQALGEAILQSLTDVDLRRQARECNLKLVAERAEYHQVMTQAEAFYGQVIRQTLSQQ